MERTYKENEIILHSPDKEEIVEGLVAKAVDKIVPLVTINEANIYSCGYIPEDNRMILWFKSMRKSVEGFNLGIHPEPFDYVFDGIPQNVYDAFLNAKNKVKFYEENIRGNYLYHREEVWSNT